MAGFGGIATLDAAGYSCVFSAPTSHRTVA